MVEYVGLDVSKEETAFCVKAADGKVLARGKVAAGPDALFEVLKEPCLCPARCCVRGTTRRLRTTRRRWRRSRAGGGASGTELCGGAGAVGP